MIDKKRLSEIELVARGLMALILLTAGASKFFSGGGFQAYYGGLFSNAELRINLPSFLFETYLNVIQYIEVSLGVALIFAALKPYTVYAWYAFMASLLVGHYILQEWSAVNQMLSYFFLGFICHALPMKREIDAAKISFWR